MKSSRWSRLGLLIVLVGAVGFLFAVAASTQRAARVRVGSVTAIEAPPGSSVWNDGLDDDDDDGDDGDDDDVTPPANPPAPSLVRLRRAPMGASLLIAEREPKAPVLPREEDPP